MDGSVQIVDFTMASLSLYVWLSNPFPFLDGHIQVVLNIVDLLHGLIADSPVGVRHRKRRPKHLCVLSFHKPLFISTNFLG